MTDTKKKEFDLRREVLYPACALFCVIVFIFFLVAMNVGINVTESEAERVTEYDNQTGVTDTENGAPAPDALPVQTLLGILYAPALHMKASIGKLLSTSAAHITESGSSISIGIRVTDRAG